MLQKRFDDKKKIRQVKRETKNIVKKQKTTTTTSSSKTIKVVKKGNAAVDHFSHMESTVLYL